jgi:hypothetical protein
VLVLRIIVAAVALAEVIAVLLSVLRLFAQLFFWARLIYIGFAALFWAVGDTAGGDPLARILELSGSSMLTLGFDTPRGVLSDFVAFSAAGVGLTLLALVITYLPSVYGAFARREAVIAKLVVRVGSPPTGLARVSRSWTLGRFDQLEEVWDGWENWFVEIAESHTTFPQGRSSRSRTSSACPIARLRTRTRRSPWRRSCSTTRCASWGRSACRWATIRMRRGASFAGSAPATSR